MKKIFITGISGTGKTTTANILSTKNVHSISIDEVPNLCFWKNKLTGKKVDYEAELNQEFINSHDWICDVEVLEQLLSVNEDTVVVLGISANQNDFLKLFDKVLLLQCKPETFIKRIIQRVDNDFGKDENVQNILLGQYQEFENELLKKGAISINAEDEVEKVAEAILAFIKK